MSLFNKNQDIYSFYFFNGLFSNDANELYFDWKFVFVWKEMLFGFVTVSIFN